MTYAGVGVNYDAMDPFKRACQKAGHETANNIERLAGGEFCEYGESRGESCYLIEAAKNYFAHVEEGLGTKNLVADAMYTLTGRSYYDHIAQDTVAMIVNDMVTIGALPLSVAMHLAVGSSDWFDDQQRSSDLVWGWKEACNLARCVWGGGETPTLKDIVMPGTIVLSGSAMGIVQPKERLICADRICEGDVIAFLPASGIHANGLTLARRIAQDLEEGYLTDIGYGRSYGDALLAPTPIYVPVIDDILAAGVVPHYLVNITGHGWRKLMRATEPFAYVIEQIPEVPPVLKFIQEHGPVSMKESYGNFNMGAGFALYIAKADVGAVAEIALGHGMELFIAGSIWKRGEEKCVEILPKHLVYGSESLAVR